MTEQARLSPNTLEVLKRRYLLKDDNRDIVESPDALFRRVAAAVAEAERNYGPERRRARYEETFYLMMRNMEFMPNSPTLMNAGTGMGQLSACFVLPVEDSIGGIFSSLRNMAGIHQTGGGTGFSFSSLRPKGDLVRSTKGEASGPVSFMRIFDAATGVVVQGGRRRGANMGILRCDHPDIEEFVTAKLDGKSFSNFNLSVAATDRFMDAVAEGRALGLVNPRTGVSVRSIPARGLFDLIARAAWKTGDPGLVFVDEINRRNPTPLIGRIEATNPCGELPLLPYESCNLASINLGNAISGGSIDWSKLRELTHLGVRFLDDVIEVNRFPLPEIGEMTFANRKIGLGVMGFADMLIKLGVSYRSPAAVETAKTVMGFIHRQSVAASAALAKERGVFPNFGKSVYRGTGVKMRNATVNTIAPTGTISIIAGCSSGIEPLFAICFVRNILSGRKLFEVNGAFEQAARAGGYYREDLMREILEKGSLSEVEGIPAETKRIFATAFDVDPLQHVKIQSAFQRFCDNSVSKTVNLPRGSTVADVKRIYRAAHKLKCKGITIYRYGSKSSQVLSFGPVSADAEYSGGCVSGVCPF